jgi:hypothetical protein
MMLQRATPAFRQVTRQTIGRRMESAGAQASSDPNRKAKLVGVI